MCETLSSHPLPDVQCFPLCSAKENKIKKNLRRKKKMLCEDSLFWTPVSTSIPGFNQPHYNINYQADKKLCKPWSHLQKADFQLVFWSFNIIMRVAVGLDTSTTLTQA